ncbi:hypothetical protein D9V87_06015 [Bacteroidetes/Chlorobi group bacterium MS-B_bin-24]|nr:MAG: hypothetical protein D9V87_06015 [Bacteroidetes/Chlorobi group bacterium MS-B_bin-24]
MRIFVIFFTLTFGLNLLQASDTDTLVISDFPRKILDELNYYNIILKSGKSTSSRYFRGFDSQALGDLYSRDDFAWQRIEFFVGDSLVFGVSNQSDTNFVLLVKKERYQWHDTLRFSESKTTRKIDYSKVYQGYKYLNPIKITIKTNDKNLSAANLEHTLLIFEGKKLISLIPEISKIVIVREEMLNKKERK